MAVAEPPKLSVSPTWAAAYPGAAVGIVVMTGVRNPDSDPVLDAMLDQTAAALRARLAGSTRAELLAGEEMAVYSAYYRRFDKTYHVLLQLESVAFKGKPLRANGSLVAAMYQAELETGLLTAGHDAAALQGPLTVDVVTPGDGYTGLGGREISAAAGDMCIRDAAGIVSSIVYGPDERTRLRPETQTAVFTTYAPAGICPETLVRHLEAIVAGVKAVSPNATVSFEVLRAS